ncbi:succinyl-diaminopimelate desuccinylase [Pararhodospirillum oryzae]|uniref:succinyl-diaminopimelate desuccinylase n=1 Tax=Pararhodospirillum oryzae TaxID=478448 RepID=UPI0011BEAB73|nr:succinyl-diaminopimelate desuccinylase [Pararhodospirillum oryzae]
MAEPLALARALIARQSVTPADDGALDVLQAALEALGFTVTRLPFGEASGTGEAARIDNLYARRGTTGPVFGFAGHTDVVPPGPGWSVDPFAATLTDAGTLVGRGVADMKGAIACFVAAVARQPLDWPRHGSLAFLITGDEEGPAVHGTTRVLEWMDRAGERWDHALVGEPTNPEALGDALKIGRRGSLNARITIHGRGGHVAYPHLADNPVHRLARLAHALTAAPLDRGSAHFPPTSLQLTSLDVGNPTTNVIPAEARLALNIRFNDHHTGAGLAAWLRERCLDACDGAGHAFTLETRISGEAFLTEPGRLSGLVAEACQAETGRRPALSTSGGTSDARFIRGHCPVVEFGLVGRTMHKADEAVAVADLETLSAIYQRVIRAYFEGPC